VSYDLEIGFEWLVDYQQSLACRDLHGFVDDDEGGGALNTGIVIFRMVDENEVSFFDFMDLVDAGGLTISITYQFGAEKLGEPLDGYGSRKTHSEDFAQR
jgi:hypothetical protein